jgi:DNA repair protein RadC
MSKDTRIATFKDFVGELTATYKRTKTPTVKVRSSIDIVNFVRPYFEECMDDHEELKIVHFNNNMNVVNLHEHTKGTDTACLCDVKDVVRDAIIIKTKAVVMVHNHPSGNLKPSQADKDLTNKLKTALAYFELKLLDSVIVTREGYFSFADEGLL